MALEELCDGARADESDRPRPASQLFVVDEEFGDGLCLQRFRTEPLQAAGEFGLGQGLELEHGCVGEVLEICGLRRVGRRGKSPIVRRMFHVKHCP